MQYEVELTTGSRPALIESVRVNAVSVSEACREARELTGNRGALRIKFAGLFMPERDAVRLERLEPRSAFADAMRADEGAMS